MSQPTFRTPSRRPAIRSLLILIGGLAVVGLLSSPAVAQDGGRDKNDQIVLTDADVSYEWVTPGHDWADSGTEVLDVTYLRRRQAEPPPGTVAPVEVPDSVEKAQRDERKRPKNLEPAPPSDAGPRQFLGYIVRVYYKDQLQAVRADPSRLLNLFPPPYTAPSQ